MVMHTYIKPKSLDQSFPARRKDWKTAFLAALDFEATACFQEFTMSSGI